MSSMSFSGHVYIVYVFLSSVRYQNIFCSFSVILFKQCVKVKKAVIYLSYLPTDFILENSENRSVNSAVALCLAV